MEDKYTRTFLLLLFQWPNLRTNVMGEENNQFTNTKGQSIIVEVKATKEETAKLLVEVF